MKIAMTILKVLKVIAVLFLLFIVYVAGVIMIIPIMLFTVVFGRSDMVDHDELMSENIEYDF
jgi:hypothetical protein